MNELCHSWHFLGQLAGSRGHGATVAWAAFHRHRQLISSGSQKTSAPGGLIVRLRGPKLVPPWFPHFKRKMQNKVGENLKRWSRVGVE